MQGVEVAPGGVEPVEHCLGMGKQAAPFLGERDTSGGPVEQPGADLRFERGDLPGHGRLGVAEQRCGAAERTLPGHDPEHFEQLDMHANMLTPHLGDAKHSLDAWPEPAYGGQAVEANQRPARQRSVVDHHGNRPARRRGGAAHRAGPGTPDRRGAGLPRGGADRPVRHRGRTSRRRLRVSARPRRPHPDVGRDQPRGPGRGEPGAQALEPRPAVGDPRGRAGAQRRRRRRRHGAAGSPAAAPLRRGPGRAGHGAAELCRGPLARADPARPRSGGQHRSAGPARHDGPPSGTVLARRHPPRQTGRGRRPVTPSGAPAARPPQPARSSSKMRVISEPRFREETERFLERVGPQEGPIAYDELVESRASRPDPELAGSPEPVRVRSDLILPLPGRPVRVRLYRSVPGPRPLLLWLHGGGFVGGSLDDVDVTCAGLARRTGLVVLSLDYRLAPEHPFPAALHDTSDTLAWLDEHGEALGGDGRLLAGGQSAGANLVAAACLVARDRGGPRVTRQVLCYPVLDLDRDTGSSRDAWYSQQYLADQAVTPYAAPLTARDLSGLPPALILGAGLDPLRADASRYAERLDRSGVDA